MDRSLQDAPLPARDNELAVPITVVVNRGGGAAAGLGSRLTTCIQNAFANAGCRRIDLHCMRGAEVAEFVARARSSRVVVGGGDGTVGAAAGALAETGRSLGILPLGTRNHLARDLGLPLDLDEAAALALNGQVRPIDLGCAGGKIFVNNCSLGLYAHMVRDRDARNLPKRLAMVPALWRVLRSPHSQQLRLEGDRCARRVRTPLLFIGNNRYCFGSGKLGQRESLADGVLSLACLPPLSTAGLVALAMRLLARKADPERDFSVVADLREVTVHGPDRGAVALDGEVGTMAFPLRVKILPRALSVVMPANRR